MAFIMKHLFSVHEGNSQLNTKLKVKNHFCKKVKNICKMKTQLTFLTFPGKHQKLKTVVHFKF